MTEISIAVALLATNFDTIAILLSLLSYLIIKIIRDEWSNQLLGLDL